MKNLFLNFDVNQGLSINYYRSYNAISATDLCDFMIDMQEEINTVLSIDNLNDLIEQLESDTWQGSSITTETLENVYKTLKNEVEYE